MIIKLFTCEKVSKFASKDGLVTVFIFFILFGLGKKKLLEVQLVCFFLVISFFFLFLLFHFLMSDMCLIIVELDKVVSKVLNVMLSATSKGLKLLGPDHEI